MSQNTFSQLNFDQLQKVNFFLNEEKKRTFRAIIVYIFYLHTNTFIFTESMNDLPIYGS